MKSVTTSVLILILAGSAQAAQVDHDLEQRPGSPPAYVTKHRPGAMAADINEIRLKVLGGYRGEPIRRTKLAVLRSLGDTVVYAEKQPDRHGAGRHLYADRDGDGVIDTGVLYNAGTGVFSADFNCDGVGDQVLADITL